MKRDVRTIAVACDRQSAFRPIERIGGSTGYYYGQWLWRLRAGLDRLVGGPGLRPGRRDPDHLEVGDPVDCWQVAAVEPGALLRLEARMKMPGLGALQFEVEELAEGCAIRQTVTFEPYGLFGHLYWIVLYPIHVPIWSGMLREIARAAMRPVPARAAS